MKKILITALIALFLAALIILMIKFWPKNKTDQIEAGPEIKYSQVKISNQEIRAEVADSEESRMRGLSGRETLCQNCGLLFVFEKSDIYPFWMKEMKFSIDIIWLKDKKIVEIVESAPTPENAGGVMNYTPKTEADMVLEVNSGFCEKYNIKMGELVEIK